MPVCHTCPLNGRGSRRCLTCDFTGDAAQHAGQTFVSLDEVGGFERPVTDNAASMDPLAEAMRAFLQLPREQQIVVQLRYLDLIGEATWTYPMIARRFRISTQAAEQRHQAAMRQWPALRALFHRKAARSARRKTATD